MKSVVRLLFTLSVVHAQQQITLRSVQLSMGTSYVNSVMTVQLEIFRSSSSSASLWQPNQCFELSVKSPYANPSDYMAFKTTPTCVAVSNGITVACQLKGFSGTTLQFQFPSITAEAQNLQSLRFTFSNFQMPYSTQQLSGIIARSYSDSECTQRMQQVEVPSVTPQPMYLPANAISIASSSNLIGDTDPATTLNVTFKPQTKMAPGGQGKIELGIPYWYQVGSLTTLMYNPDAMNMCSSPCMKIKSSILQVTYLNIQYTDMTQACINGSPITITCPGFYNPIYQDKWYGFYVYIYDNEASYQPISKSDLEPSLDATKFEPYSIPPSSFSITPLDKTVNTFSEWTITLTPKLPMMQECYIRIYIPTGLQFSFQSIEASGIFIPYSRKTLLSTSDVIIIKGTPDEPRQSILFSGCYDLSSLGKLPSGRLLLEFLQTQVAVMDSNQFSVDIYKDDLLTQKIAVLAPGTILKASDIKPGDLINLQLYPLISTVQLSTLLYINFTTQHNLYPNAMITVVLPASLTAPTGQINVIGLASQSSGSQQSTYATIANVSDSTITIYNFVSQIIKAPYTFVFAVDQVYNQISSKDAGEFSISTHYDNNGVFAVIDTMSAPNSFTATPNIIDSSGQIIVQDPTNYKDNVRWTFVFSPPSAIPKLGHVQLDFPSSFKINQTNACVNCKWTSNTSVVFTLQSSSSKNQELSFTVDGVKNPRSFMPTPSFRVTTYDTDGLSTIDTGFNVNTAMTVAGAITKFQVGNLNQTNGAITTYTFHLDSIVPMMSGDLLFFTFPQEIQLKASECFSTQNIACSVSGNNVKITLDLNSSSLQWNMTQVVNPPSQQPSSPFTNIEIKSSLLYTVSSLAQAEGITNTMPASLSLPQLIQDSYLNSTAAPYTFQFTPTNPLAPTGSIIIQYPDTIKVSQNVSCVVTTYAVFSNVCVFSKNTISISGVFNSSVAYQSQITITISNVTNPLDNSKDLAFNITTYNGQFMVDTSVNQIKPLLACDYPCATCSGTRSNCTACWDTTVTRYLMPPGPLPGRCEPQCDFGFTSNGQLSKICSQCDQSCLGCNDKGDTNDSIQCLSCSPRFQYRLNNTQLCQQQCAPGQFQMSDTQCGFCNKPCETCQGGPNLCTTCYQNSTVPNMHQNKCITTCPAGTTSIAGVCEPCSSPCQTCNGTQQQCLTCDKTDGRDILFNGMCYKECPIGYATNFTQKTCVGCLAGCDLCNLLDTAQCLRCSVNLALFNNTCFGNCPEGYKARNRVCVNNLEDDLYVMYFPFLIASLIFVAVVLVGKLKRKALLVNGSMVLVSSQHSIPTICAFIGPLQTLCTIAQFVLSYYYGYLIHFILALVVYVVQVVFNAAFLIWYVRNFYSKKLPELGSTIVVRGRPVIINWQNQRQNYQDKDPKFSQFVEKHKLTTLILFLLIGGIHFKFVKMFYSHYWSFGSFKAKWSRATYFRTSLVRWQLAYALLVDLTMIIISAFGLLSITLSNQLWICMVESIVLAVVLVVLGLVELRKIKSILSYTESQSAKYQPPQIMHKYKNKLQLNQKVKVKSHFNDRKLADLLEMFGSKKCQSFIEIRKDFEAQEDERELATWPISPKQQREAMLLDLPKFTTADQYFTIDNVYCEGVTINHQTCDFSVQAGEAQQKEFQDALDRKQNVFLSEALIDQTNDISVTRKLRKRGRQNRFYNMIEQEDGQQVDEATQEKIVHKLIKTQFKKDKDDRLKNASKEALRIKEAAARLQQKLEREEKKYRQEMLAKEELELTQRNLIDTSIQPVSKAELDRLRQIEQLEKERHDLIRKEELQQRQVIDASFKLRQSVERKEYQRLIQVQKDNERKEQERLARAAVEEQKKKAKFEKEKEKQMQERAKQILQEEVPVVFPYSYQQSPHLQPPQSIAQSAERQSALPTEQSKRQFPSSDKHQDSIPFKEPRQDSAQKQMERARQLQIKQAQLQVVKQSSIVSDDAQSERIHLNHNFHKQFKEPHPRLFNENECLGYFDRDNKANILVIQSTRGYEDKRGNQTNQRGYLINKQTQAVVDQTGQALFKLQQLDSTGELPMPFALERFNFNAHQIQGDFDYSDGQMQIKQTNSGYQDKRGNKVNAQGWLVNQNKIVDNLGNVKLHGEVPLLFNFKGKKFDVRDVMGQFKKEKGSLVIQNNRDLQGRLCNDKGYLVDQKGNIIDKYGRQIWAACDLIQGEFMKILPYTKFDISKVQADLEIIDGYPRPQKQLNGALLDRQGRLVNSKGYLVDPQGNVINCDGDRVFDFALLSPEGEIPQVFRGNQLKDDTGSSISRLMSEIERGANDQSALLRQEGSDTSVDSKMADTPANYNMANQRYDSLNQEYTDNLKSEFTDDLQVISKKNKHKKKRFLKPTPRQINLAGAYGGEAKPELRRPRVKYDKDRLKGSQQFRGASSKPLAQLSETHKGQDFEKAYEKDIDQFLEDSEWDIDQLNLDKLSSSSDGECLKQKADQSIQALERNYLGSHTTITQKRQSKQSASPKKPNTKWSVNGPKRTTILNITDDPQVIHKGAILEFETRL